MSEWEFHENPNDPKNWRPVPLPAYPPDNHKPGFGSTNAPPSAPPTATDQATQADKRLKDMWEQHSYYGAKPGKQTGSVGVNDKRNASAPLPSQPAMGGPSGPIGGRWSFTDFCQPMAGLPDPRCFVPWVRPPVIGVWPMLHNSDGKGSEKSGTTQVQGMGGLHKSEADKGYDKPGGGNRGPESSQSDDLSFGKLLALLGSIFEGHGSRTSDPPDDPYQAAMDAQDSFWTHGMPVDDSDPTGSQGRELTAQAIPFGDWLFDKADALTGGTLSKKADNMPRWLVETLGANTFLAQITPVGLIEDLGQATSRAGANVADDVIRGGATAADNAVAANASDIIRGGPIKRWFLPEWENETDAISHHNRHSHNKIFDGTRWKNYKNSGADMPELVAHPRSMSMHLGFSPAEHKGGFLVGPGLEMVPRLSLIRQ